MKKEREQKRTGEGKLRRNRHGMTIGRLALCNDKNDRTRSILVMVTVCLTTLLLVLIASYGYGMLRSQKVNAGLASGSHYGYFKKAGEKQIEQMRLRSEFDQIGRMALMALTQQDGAMYYADETALLLNNMENRLIEGHYPEEGNEIAAGASFLKLCGMKEPKVGDTVTLQRRFDMETPYEEETYTVSGIIRENEVGSGIYRAVFVSEEYYESVVLPQEREYNVCFTLQPSVQINTDNAEEVIRELASLVGVEEKDVKVNNDYLRWSLYPGTELIVGCVLISGCIVLFSVLVIYNIFQVGIVRRIQEYGKIRALGASKKQMRQLIQTEGMVLAAVGIPVGTVLGTVSAKLSFEYLMRLEGIYRPQDFCIVSPICPPLIFLVVLFCLFTVWIALRRPMRLVAAVSPIEAVRYQEGSAGKKEQGVRRGKRKMGVAGLTFASLSANKKRTAMTIVTMGLSCTLFVVLANLAGNIDMEYDARKTVEYGDFQIEIEYSIGDKAYPEENLDAILREDPIDAALLEDLRAIDGVKEVSTQNILYAQLLDAEGNVTEKDYSVLVLDQDLFERELEAGGYAGEFSYESVSKEPQILWGAVYFMDDEGVAVGDEKRLLLTDGIRQAQLQARVAGAFGMLGADWAITEEVYRRLGFEDSPVSKVWVTCEEGKEKSVEAGIRELLLEKEHLELETYEDALEVSRMSMELLKLIVYLLSGMVAVISFLNMANTLVVSAVTRRQEFGVLQAIGMTSRQLNASLQGEGLIFTLGTLAVAMLVGIPCGYGLFRYGKAEHMFGLNQYHFPVTELAALVLFLVLFQILLSFLLTRSVRRESVIERIRYRE